MITLFWALYKERHYWNE